MEYKQGLDRVGDSTSFPFPIKLKYDSENIYLTPLWIPETSSVLVVKDKITKQPINLLDANELGNLWLCLEIIDGKSYKPTKHVRITDADWRWISQTHPTRGGKYRITFGKGDFNESIPHFLNTGTTYSIPYSTHSFSNRYGQRIIETISPRYPDFGNGKWFVHIRGTYRYGTFLDNSSYDLKRTGIYSNVVKLEFDIET